MCPLSEQDSRTRVVVVPTETMCLLSCLAALSDSAVSGESVNHSECILWSRTESTLTGSKVPLPTWRVRNSFPIPFSSSSLNTLSVKWRPAVGAATEPLSFAYIV